MTRAARTALTAIVLALIAPACASEDEAGPNRTAPHDDNEPSRSTKAEPSSQAERETPTAIAGAAATKPPAESNDDELSRDDEPIATDHAIPWQDRCISPTCEPSLLPEQPELEFLQDMGDGWQRLLEADWQVASGAEGYRCITFTVPEDINLVAFSPQVPIGTHHITFGVSAVPNGPDRAWGCQVDNAGERNLLAGGAGSEPSYLPAGVAMPVKAGSQVFMNMHLFNVSDLAKTGRSGMWIKTVPRDQVENEAEFVGAGPLQLNIPVGRSVQTGTCTMRADATIYAVSPHMHLTGVHASATITDQNGQNPTQILDTDVDPFHGVVYDVGPYQVKAGDQVHVACTYMNETDVPLHWGDSVLAEMCFVNLSLYPAIGYGSQPCSF